MLRRQSLGTPRDFFAVRVRNIWDALAVTCAYLLIGRFAPASVTDAIYSPVGGGAIAVWVLLSLRGLSWTRSLALPVLGALVLSAVADVMSVAVESTTPAAGLHVAGYVGIAFTLARVACAPTRVRAVLARPAS